MDAYELADKIDMLATKKENCLPTKARDMIRQQADQIAMLEAELSAYRIQLKELGLIK